MMFWPSIMSLAPPPVTPSLKLPPRFGTPPPFELLEVPHAASTLAIDAPAASMPMPMSNWRRVMFPPRYIRSRVDLSSIYALTSGFAELTSS